MTILGIDTAGFSTTFAVVKDGRKVLLNFVNPGYKINKEWDEVVRILPELHFDFLSKNFEKKFKENNVKWSDIDAIAVSAGSGISSCITMGKSFAKMYSEKYKKPLIKVDHVLTHAYSTWIENDYEKFSFPILSFSSSGSHNNFALISTKKYCKNLNLKEVYDLNNNTKFYIGLGKYFFRVYSYLDLEEEGGWQKFFKLMEKGDPKKYDSLNLKVKRHYGFSDNLFNFSDLMNGIKNFIKDRKKENGNLTEKEKSDIAASFQYIVADEVANASLFLTRLLNVKEVHINGGLSMNKCIINRVKQTMQEEFPKIKIRIPNKAFRLDNAAMTAALAFYIEKYNIVFKNFKPIITK